jgi:hypothetical protein
MKAIYCALVAGVFAALAVQAYPFVSSDPNTVALNRDRGAPRGATPPTSPGMRITHRAIPYGQVCNKGSPSSTK